MNDKRKAVHGQDNTVLRNYKTKTNKTIYQIVVSNKSYDKFQKISDIKDLVLMC